MTPSTNEHVLSLNGRANQKKTKDDFQRVIWLAGKKRAEQEYDCCLYLYIVSIYVEEGKPRTTSNQKKKLM